MYVLALSTLECQRRSNMKEVKQFKTESKELLNLMINSIYSNKEIFLRELISNASDAIDKYRFLSLSNNEKYPTLDHFIRLDVDKKKRTITITDNGIGMSKDDLENSLGTIAKSGSKEFLEKFKEAKDKNDFNIIGQFGVGFYSAFMVADRVEVLTKNNDDVAYLFTSEGKDSYSIEEAKKDTNGTQIVLYLKKSSKEDNYDDYLDEYEIKNLVKKYSDYVRYPIKMEVEVSKPVLDKDGKEVEGKTEKVKELQTLNSMIPLWKKNKREVKEEELNEFYKSKFMDYENPLLYLQLKIEGKVDYDSLLFIPSHAPYNLYSENYEKGLELYSKGIFIKDKCPELLPDYLKFVKGLVDSDAFNLNISREMLQKTPAMKIIAENIEKKIVEKLKETKEKEFDKYLKFWKEFGEYIKYGIYSTYGAKKELLEDLLIFHSLNKEEDGYISLKEYVEKMNKDQKFIYYASGENLASIKLLPQLEKYRKNGIDVLLLDQKIDEFALMMLREYDKKELKSIQEDSQDDLSEDDKNKVEEVTTTHKRLLDTLKESLSSNVSDVIISAKLVDSPVCISTKDGLSLEMEKTINEQNPNGEDVKSTKILEINPEHEIFKAFTRIEGNDELVKEYASILYDEALLLEGHDVSNKTEFVKKLNQLITKAF